ncbi:hypothetical protein OGAPHI_005169 [Ogataea philodendri]|uniref:DNA-directed RNA polymerase III subunit RPC4 n=1 Tax=Ogataea philodendri TaxID=1378263 RepID=A0A9P8P209_9ASCO|nr:uncharacterized protein OGAPHI_005169 [Ogataea philodendri]KAH3663767.1 hypothetical protein OGAPHI_005169 [Ogataea philodendri]
MSNNRLDSISRPSGSPSAGGAAKQSLRFKPKVVARRTKEERDSNVPVATPGVSKKPASLAKTVQRTQKLSGPRHLQNTKVVMAGPLSQGAVSVSNTGHSDRHRIVKKSSESLNLAQSLKSQVAKQPKQNADYDDSDDDTETKIDLGQSYDWNDVNTQLFPVRAERQQHFEYGEEAIPDTSIKTEFHREVSVIPDSEPSSREQSVEIKKEDPEATLSIVPDEKENVGVSNNDYQTRIEAARLEEDYREIVHRLENADIAQDGNDMLFLQLPENLDSISSAAEIKPEESVDMDSGVIGKIRVHQSGKVTIQMGATILDVTRGGVTQTVQSIVHLDQENKQCIEIGNVGEKLIASLSLTDE